MFKWLRVLEPTGVVTKPIDTFCMTIYFQMSGQHCQPPVPGQGCASVLQVALSAVSLLLDRDRVLAREGGGVRGPGGEGGGQPGLATEGVQQRRVQELRQSQGGGLRVSDEQETCVRRQETDVRWICAEK